MWLLVARKQIAAARDATLQSIFHPLMILECHGSQYFGQIGERLGPYLGQHCMGCESSCISAEVLLLCMS